MSPIIGVIDSSKLKAPPFTTQLAYDSIASTLLSSTNTTVTFSGIPQTYAHLELRIFGRINDSTSNGSLYIQANNNSSNSYAYVTVQRFYGINPSVITSPNDSAYTLSNCLPGGTTNLINGYSVTRITDYTETTKNKAIDSYWGWVTAESQAGFANVAGRVGYTGGAWNNTSAITSLTITNQGPNFATGSMFALYGIKSGF